jgi:hypothetical protein
MLKNYAQDYYILGTLLKGVHAEAHFDTNKEQSLGEERIKKLVEFCEYISLQCDKVGLRLSVILADRLANQLPKNPTYGYLKTAIPELDQRIEDELASVLFLHVPSSKSEYYTNSELFSAEVANRFPSAIVDIEEAGKCYAVSRHTACVFHLMRVMEIGLRSVAKSLGIPDTNILPSWQSIIDKINKEINGPNAAKSPDWKRLEPFYKGVSAQLFAVKVAWRNPAMHVESTYNEEVAGEIFNAVRGFMRHIATELSE